jgi:hypothetical protein
MREEVKIRDDGMIPRRKDHSSLAVRGSSE